MIIFGLLHIATSTLLAYLLAILFGGLQAWSAIASLLFGAVFGYFLRKRVGLGLGEFGIRKFSPDVAGVLEKLLFVFLGYAAYRHFAWMLYRSDGNWRTLSLNNFGDLPLHINYIRFFAQGAPFPPVNPGYSVEPLRYPLGMDLYNALWETVGVETSAHLFAVGIFAFLASFVALRLWAGWLAIGGFFLNGGLIGFEFFAGRPYDKMAESALGWKNLFLTVFITQRGFLFALPVGVLLLHFARKVLREELRPTKLQVQVFGILWGSLALFHIHTFFAVSLLIAALTLIYFSSAKLKFALKLLSWALPLGTIFTLHSTGFLKKAGVIHWRPGWTVENQSFISYFAYNFGLWILMVLATVGVLVYRKRWRELKEWVVATAMFAVFLNVMLAPWSWDNIKVLIWPYLLILALAHTAIQTFSQEVRRSLEVSLLVVLLYSGTTMVGRTLGRTNEAPNMASFEMLAKGEGAIKDVPREAVFAAATTHDHVLAWLGRARVLGYEGHLWSHGINSTEQKSELLKIMQGTGDVKDAAQRLKATHLFWGPHEINTYGEMPANVKNGLRNISPVPGYEVYELPKN